MSKTDPTVRGNMGLMKFATSIDNLNESLTYGSMMVDASIDILRSPDGIVGEIEYKYKIKFGLERMLKMSKELAENIERTLKAEEFNFSKEKSK